MRGPLIQFSLDLRSKVFCVPCKALNQTVNNNEVVFVSKQISI